MSVRVQAGWAWNRVVAIIVAVNATLFPGKLYPRGLFPKKLFP